MQWYFERKINHLCTHTCCLENVFALLKQSNTKVWNTTEVKAKLKSSQIGRILKLQVAKFSGSITSQLCWCTGQVVAAREEGLAHSLVCMRSAKSELFLGPACHNASTSTGTQFLDDSKKDQCFPVAGWDPSHRCPWDGSEEAVKRFVPVREQSAAFNCWLLSGLPVQICVFLPPAHNRSVSSFPWPKRCCEQAR